VGVWGGESRTEKCFQMCDANPISSACEWKVHLLHKCQIALRSVNVTRSLERLAGSWKSGKGRDRL